MDENRTVKRKFRRLHKLRCGVARSEYDGYEDVREACERKLRQWEREGILASGSAFRNNDWLFGGSGGARSPAAG